MGDRGGDLQALNGSPVTAMTPSRPIAERERELAKAAWARRALISRGDAFLMHVGPVVMAMRGYRTAEEIASGAAVRPHRAFSEIAAELTAKGFKTAQGGPWTAAAVASVAERIKAKAKANPAFIVTPGCWRQPERIEPEWDTLSQQFREASMLNDAAAQLARAVKSCWDDAANAAERCVEETRVRLCHGAMLKLREAANESRREGKSQARIEGDIRFAEAGRSAASRAAADRRRAAVLVFIEMRRSGATLAAIAERLNREGIARSRSGAPWTKAALSQFKVALRDV
jgi:hypothetical protein